MLRTLVTLAFAVAPAAVSAATFVATPVVRPAAVHIIANDISWNCGDGACIGATEESRPLVLCQDLAQRAGRMTSFVVDGRPISGSQLGNCNPHARAAAPIAQARP